MTLPSPNPGMQMSRRPIVPKPSKWSQAQKQLMQARRMQTPLKKPKLPRSWRWNQAQKQSRQTRRLQTLLKKPRLPKPLKWNQAQKQSKQARKMQTLFKKPKLCPRRVLKQTWSPLLRKTKMTSRKMWLKARQTRRSQRLSRTTTIKAETASLIQLPLASSLSLPPMRNQKVMWKTLLSP